MRLTSPIPRSKTPVLLLGAFACCLYAPSLSGDFTVDDDVNIVHNAFLQDPAQWPRFLYDPASQSADPMIARHNYRPVVTLSYALNRLAGGLNSAVYRAASILIHAANTCLVFTLAQAYLGAGPGAWGAALLFAVHPVQVESVANASFRSGPLCAFFCMLGLILAARRPRASLAAFGLGLFSKESAVSMIPVLAAQDRVSPGGPRRGASAGKYAPYVLLACAYWLLRRAVIGAWGQHGPWGGRWFSHWQFAVHGLSQDVALLFRPSVLRVCYSIPQGNWFLAESVLMALLWAALAGLTLFAFVRRERTALPLVWLLAGLLPVSNIVPLVTLSADRYLYTPLIGISLLWGQLIAQLPRRNSILAAGALAMLLTPFNLERQFAWRNDFVLDLEARAAAPLDPCAALRLSSFYFKWRMLDRAEALVLEALDSDDPMTMGPALRDLAAIENARRPRRKL